MTADGTHSRVEFSVREVAEADEGAERSAICERILRALPHWFGVESAIVDYLA